MSEFWSEHELTNLQVLLYVGQFFCIGIIIGVLVGVTNKKKKE